MHHKSVRCSAHMKTQAKIVAHTNTKSDKPTKCITRLDLTLSLYLPPPISFSACQIIYISLSVFLKAQTQYAHTPTHRQAVRGTKK